VDTVEGVLAHESGVIRSRANDIAGNTLHEPLNVPLGDDPFAERDKCLERQIVEVLIQA